MKFTADDIRKLGTILSVWAHPDDESWCMAGVLAQAVANGQRVVCITATRGDAGMTSDETRWPQSQLGEIREKELEASLEILGVSEHYWMDYKDGHLADSDSQPAMTQIIELIKQVKPDTIFSFGSDGLTGHTDHITVYEWTKQAMQQSGSNASLYAVTETTEFYESEVCQKADEKFSIYFNIDKPKTVDTTEADLVFELPEEIRTKKIKSLEAHACQMERFLQDPVGVEFIKALSEREAFLKEKIV